MSRNIQDRPSGPSSMDSTGYPYGPRGRSGQGQQGPVVDVPDFDSSYISPDQAFQGSQGASELSGKLARAQWEDWKKRYSPYIEKLADYANDPNAASDAADQAKSSMGMAFDSSTAATEQQRSSFGIQMTPEQKEASERKEKVNRAASMVSAGNEARISAQDRQQAILAGGMGMSNVPKEVMN